MTLQHQLITISTLLLFSGCASDAGDAAAHAEIDSQNESAVCENALSANQEKTALKLIDDICGDTWCEGDNNFAFERLTCRTGPIDSPHGGSCTLRLRLIPREDDPPSYARICTTGGFRGYDSLVDAAQSGYPSLDWDYYLALTDCIASLEARLPH